MSFAAVHESAIGRYCCKSPKIPGCNFFERNEAKLYSPINMAPRPLAKPPVSLSQGHEVPHIFVRESHQRPRKILISGGKGLLQQNRHSRASNLAPWKVRAAEIECRWATRRSCPTADSRLSVLMVIAETDDRSKTRPKCTRCYPRKSGRCRRELTRKYFKTWSFSVGANACWQTVHCSIPYTAPGSDFIRTIL